MVRPSRRSWPARAAIAAVVAVLAAPVGGPAVAPSARADHLESHIGPAEPARSFPDGFVELLPRDSQAAATTTTPAWRDDRVGGWGGGSEACPDGHVDRPPVVLVHGNTEDAAFWRANPSGEGTVVNVRDRFLRSGWCADELWAISYTGSRGYTTYNDLNVDDLAGFVAAVQEWTGAQQVDVVGHSLGVTVVRRTAQLRPAFASAVRRFVAIAGANEGTTSCRGSGTLKVSHVCEEVEPGSAWLAALNAAPDALAHADIVTIYDGSGATDQFYLGPDARSPRLPTACNHAIPGTPHLTLARGEVALRTYVPFLATGMLPVCQP